MKEITDIVKGVTAILVFILLTLIALACIAKVGIALFYWVFQ